MFEILHVLFLCSIDTHYPLWIRQRQTRINRQSDPTISLAFIYTAHREKICYEAHYFNNITTLVSATPCVFILFIVPR